MSYVLFPARETNFFPPGPPYLAGLRGFGSLGDYAADLAAYNTAMTKWRLAKLNYDKAIKFNAAKIKVIDAAYDAALASYNADKAQWDHEYGAYVTAATSWEADFARYKAANATRAKTVESSYGLTLPQSFYDNGACVTQAQHDNYARLCVTVKGLGMTGLGSSDPACGGKALPVCQFGPYPTLRAKPKAPTRAAYPANPVSPGPAPVAPTPPPATSTTPIPVTPPTTAPGPDQTLTPVTAEDSKHANVLMNGLVLVAVLGGGYLVWRTLKKPKAQAA